MRRTITTLVVGMVLLSMVAAAHAQQSEIQVLRDAVKQLSDQLKAVTEKLQELEAKEAAPVAPAAPEAPKANWTDKLQINGYVQSQYIQRANAIDDFSLRRMYLNIAANVTPDATAVVQFERVGGSQTITALPTTVTAPDPTITLSSCFVDYKFNDDYSVMFGQIPTYFGWDEWESSSRRIVLDRFAAVEGLGARDARPGAQGFYFGGPWDRGFYVTRKGAGSVPTVIAGLVNGNFRANDNNNNKAYNLDLRWKQGAYQYGASWLDGKFGPQGIEQPRHAYDLYFHRDPCPWGFQAEYINGTWGFPVAISNREGWYGQVAYNKGGVATPYVRYEQFDKANTTECADTYMALHLGCAWQIDKYNEITAEVTDAHLGDTDMDYSGVQWQIGF